jgi:hypothetical protein
MITRKHLFFAIAATCLLTMFAITIVPIKSQTVGHYDPWLDENDDGKIDGKDIALPALIYGTAGTPINKTALLLELQSDVASLNSSLLALENTVATQQSEINNLGAELATKLGAPDYDSGFLPVLQGQSITLTHNLGTTNVLVYMIGYNGNNVGNEIHQIEYGGDLNGGAGAGAYWSTLTTTTINIYRMPNDTNWSEIRVQIWILA